MPEPRRETPVVDTARKTPGQTCIAHISDLHLRGSDDLSANPWRALTRDLESRRALVDLAIVSGRAIVGQAYRRREEVLCIQLPGRPSDAYYEDFPATAARPRHTVVMAVPLFHPLRRGRLIGVLNLASRSNTSGLLVLDHDRAARAAVAAQTHAWFATRIVGGFGFEPRERAPGNP